MGQQRNWTQDEIEYLEESWGSVSVPAICEKLNRSYNAVIVRKNRLGLGAFLENGGYITLNQLLKAIGIGNISYKHISWISERGMPVRRQRIGKCTFRVVYYDDFWKWAYKNKAFIDWSKMDEYALGAEPEWLRELRIIQSDLKRKYKTTPWTFAEDERLRRMISEHKHTVGEVSERLGRTNGAVEKRRHDLGIKEKLVHAPVTVKWTTAQLAQLNDLIIKGCPYEYMSDKLGRSVKAIRVKIYVLYGTENIDKASMIISKNQTKRKEG